LRLNILLSIALSLSAISCLFCQTVEVIPADRPPFSPEALIENYFIGEGVELEQGIVLSTGEVDKIDGPSSSESSTVTSFEDIQDPQLRQIVGADVLKDVAFYEITFKPTADTIQFNYVFASEEYPEFVCSIFNDVFGFFISGPNPAGGNYDGQNIAIVPGTNGIPVSINTVNSGMAGISGDPTNCPSLGNPDLSHLFNANESENFIFDGVLEPFIAAAKVIPCETYTIRFSIGDAIDFLKDSAVFLEGKSFSSNTLNVKAVTVSANGTITEGCSEATIIFELPENSTGGQEITFDIIGSAENGIDIEFIDTEVLINAGSSIAEVQIIPLEDDLVEEIESLGIVVSKGLCSIDTLWIGIEDNLLTPPDEQGPFFLCDDPSVDVDFTIPFDSPSPIVFRNQNEIRIEPIETQIFSTIKVENIFPSTLNQTDFIQVCIDELSHPWIGDLSIFLFGPDNQFIELSSNNGGNGGNGTAQDFFLDACFTFDATQMLSAPSLQPPYIGEFLPEGNWDDFFGSSSYKVNGDWRLMMIDDFQGSVGILKSWSIHFGRSYNINYSWSPNQDISCTDCPNPSFSPSESRTYTLNIEDTNGCSLEYEVLIETDATNIEAPMLSCDNSQDDALSISWENTAGAESYQIRVDGGEWINLNQELTYTENGVNPGTVLLFEVQAIGACGESEISSTTCSTGQCGLLLDLVLAQDPECDEPNTGIINVQAIGGMEPYTYQLGEITNNEGIFENLVGGEHTIIVTDSDECQNQLLVVLTSKAAISIEAQIFNATCKESNGRIELTLSGGNGDLELEWSSNFGGNLNALAPDTYILVVTDEDGCMATKEFIIGEQANFEVNFSVIQPLCSDQADGSISALLNNPSLVDDIIWSNGISGSLNNNLLPGTYTVSITSIDGCEFSQSFDIEATSNLEAIPNFGNTLCNGGNDGFASLSVSGGAEPYNIEWSNGILENQITDLSAGTYSAIIVDNLGCELFDTIVIAEPEELRIDEVFVESLSCDSNLGTVELFPIGGTPPYLVSVNQDAPIEDIIFENLGVGTYSFEIIDNSGCSISTNEPVVIEPIDEIELLTISGLVLELGESINLEAWVTNRDKNQVSLEWIPNDTEVLSCTNCESPEFTGTQTTTIEVIATDGDGCIATSFVTIFVDNSAEIYVPSAFSPNGDGINDVLMVFGKQTTVSSIDEFNVYDRWGTQLSTFDNLVLNNQSIGWDGRFNGIQMNNGVYVWSLEVTFIDGSKQQLSGDVTLIK